MFGYPCGVSIMILGYGSNFEMPALYYLSLMAVMAMVKHPDEEKIIRMLSPAANIHNQFYTN
jgi:hypothetical protein